MNLGACFVQSFEHSLIGTLNWLGEKKTLHLSKWLFLCTVASHMMPPIGGNWDCKCSPDGAESRRDLDSNGEFEDLHCLGWILHQFYITIWNKGM